MGKKLIKIFDTTLRDGEQSPGASLNAEEKVEIAMQLEKMKVSGSMTLSEFDASYDFSRRTSLCGEDHERWKQRPPGECAALPVAGGLDQHVYRFPAGVPWGPELLWNSRQS